MQTNPHTHDDRVVIPSLKSQIGLPELDSTFNIRFSAPAIDLDKYDHIIVCMSGGKDSIASILRLKEMGADMSKVELWHHDVDGNEGSDLMDWRFTRSYNRKFAAAMGLPLYFSWLQGGFEMEMLKENSFSMPHKVETPDGLITLDRDTKRAKAGTRLRFPQLSASLQTRWCSSALKIDVGRRALNNQERFNGKRILFVTGERRQESVNRSKYNQLEPHACDRRGGRRLVDSWRPVLHWGEEEVWDCLCRHGVIAPVPYRLGWTRSSCMTCIYNSPAIWATIRHYFPERAEKIAAYEDRFGTTISRQKINVIAIAGTAKPRRIDDIEALVQAFEEEYTLPVLLGNGEKWVMPAGAFGKEGCGSD